LVNLKKIHVCAISGISQSLSGWDSTFLGWLSFCLTPISNCSCQRQASGPPLFSYTHATFTFASSTPPAFHNLAFPQSIIHQSQLTAPLHTCYFPQIRRAASQMKFKFRHIKDYTLYRPLSLQFLFLRHLFAAFLHYSFSCAALEKKSGRQGRIIKNPPTVACQ